MSAIIPFQFEAHALRVQVDDLGLPWFNASDICSVLEFGNPRQAIESHVDPDDVQKLDVIDNLGRTQRANHVNESGLYALILGSTKDAAKRFKRWVTSEVLPAIRKTGGYTVSGALATLPAPTHDRVSAILLIGEAVAKVPGVKPGIAAAATLTCIQENTGLAVETQWHPRWSTTAEWFDDRLAPLVRVGLRHQFDAHWSLDLGRAQIRREGARWTVGLNGVWDR